MMLLPYLYSEQMRLLRHDASALPIQRPDDDDDDEDDDDDDER